LYRKYDPGATIGGPLYIPGVYNTQKDKTFFFFSEEYRHEKEPVAFNQAVPSAIERTGNFSDICPTSGTVDIATRAGFVFTRSLAASRAASSVGLKVPYFPDCPGTASGTFIPVPSTNPLVPSNVFPIFDTLGTNNQIALPSLNPQSMALVNSGLIPLPTSVSG